MNTEVAIKATKFVTRTVAAAGVTKIVKDIIANNVSAPENAYQKVTIYAGAAFVGMMAKDAVKEYTDKQIDEAVEAIKAIKAKVNDAKKEETQESQEQS